MLRKDDNPPKEYLFVSFQMGVNGGGVYGNMTLEYKDPENPTEFKELQQILRDTVDNPKAVILYYRKLGSK
jgi:hypothetical protein